MTPDINKLIAQHVKDTGFCSSIGHMASVSSTYKEIIDLEETALPAILSHLNNPANNSGMNVLMLLMSIVKDRPYTPPEVAPGFVGFKVQAAREAWLKWGKENKYL
jgi:hypothetical protein